MPLSFRTIEELRKVVPKDAVINAPISKMWEDYLRIKSMKKVADLYGVSLQTISNKFKGAGYSQKNTDFCTDWTDDEIKILTWWYSGDKTDSELNLNDLAETLGRHKSLVCRKARTLGLTNKNRETTRSKKGPKQPRFKTKEELKAFQSDRSKRMIAENGHPRGALGMRHSEETKRIISEAAKNWYALLTEEEKSNFLINRRKRQAEADTPPSPHGKWKAGWRIVGDREIFFRSSWEANYARFLQWMLERGDITAWEHESETFWFDGISRGCMSYLPDFKVRYKDETIEYHEVKGWMCSRSVTSLNRMKIYHPTVKIVLIDKTRYTEIKNVFSKIISEWE